MACFLLLPSAHTHTHTVLQILTYFVYNDETYTCGTCCILRYIHAQTTVCLHAIIYTAHTHTHTHKVVSGTIKLVLNLATFRQLTLPISHLATSSLSPHSLRCVDWHSTSLQLKRSKLSSPPMPTTEGERSILLILCSPMVLSTLGML